MADGRTYITTAWWLIALPGIFIFLTALSINLFGLWLRMINTRPTDGAICANAEFHATTTERGGSAVHR